jgi:hypothetical protein
MKRNLVAIFAVVLAVTVSSFTTKKVNFFYLVYQGGTERQQSNYSQQSSQPDHQFDELASPTLNWFRVSDTDSDNSITTAEFNASFDSYDVVNPTNALLSDESADISGQLDLINKQ